MGAENIDYESGASYIHTSQARTLLMQKLMEGRDMGEMSWLKTWNLKMALRMKKMED